ncbi:thymidine kinase [Bacillus pumilus]|uniref:thymidine kinase n=1 Tax=Bacillus pumilus TaxID=1408 RepID=UPI0028CBB2DF|nr:thymidine kinase [Bacillus pumilus]
MIPVGSLTIDVGSMFAEKSTALQRHGKRYMLAGKKVVFLKPSIDNRYSEDFIVTHDGKKVEAINIQITNKNEVGIPLDLFEADVVCIDEVQFFPDQMITHIEKLIEQGKKVFVAGLDMDRYGKPFGIVPYLMAKADHVTKHHAVCVFCGDDAWVSLEVSNDSSTQVKVGDDYKPACRQCAYERGVK